VEALEDRSLPSAYLVTTTADSGPGSLRDAITQVNADTSHVYASLSNANVDEIDFAVTAASDTGGGYDATTGVATITPQSALPVLTNAVTIDGTTQPGYAASPLIELLGSSVGTATNGLTVESGGAGSTIKGLVIDGFGGNGIELDASNCTIATNYIGTNPAGSAASANGADGVYVYGANNETIGGTAATARNIISGNAGDGIAASFGTGDVIQNNYIGTDVTGSAALGNTGYGILSYGVNNVTLGGIGAGNVVSANGGDGVIDGQGSGWVVQGNLIGTDANVTHALGNGGNSLRFDGPYAAYNIIGGVVSGSSNTIAGNSGNGAIMLSSAAHNNVVEGNYIGTNSAGADLGNTSYGVLVYGGANNNLIGGVGTGAGNVIAYNSAGGVSDGVPYDSNVGVVGNTVRGNSMHDNGGIGIDLGGDGVTLNGAHTGTGPNNWQYFPVLYSTQIDSSGNLTVTYSVQSQGINLNYPLTIDFYVTDSFGEGKTYIGTDTWTSADLANGQKTISLGNAAALGVTAATALVATATDTTGDTSEFSASQINQSTFQVTNTNDSGPGSLRQAILNANYHAGQDAITFDIPGTSVQTIHLLSPLPTIVEAITVDGTTQPGYTGSPLIELQGSGAGASVNGLTVGSLGRTGAGSAIKGLVIDGFGGNGIELDASNCTIASNYIGTNPAGSAASANGADGVYVYGYVSATNNETIGGTTAAARNIISGNAGDGIAALFSTGDVIQGNYIGTNAAGTAAVGNAGYGIDSYGASNVTLGGLTATPGTGPGNVISGNGLGAIMGSNWLVQGNLVGTNAADTAALGNNSFGLRIAAGTNTTIGGTAAGAANVIAANGFNGILLSDGAHNNVVEGNYIGTNNAGANLGNTYYGVLVYAGANNNLIGGVGSGAGNVIAYNSAGGVSVGVPYDSNVGVVANAILGNSIYSNGGPGIVLSTPAANNGQAAPVLTSVISSGTGTTITGTLAAYPSTSFRIEFFSNPTNAAGQGRTFVGFVQVSTDAQGDFIANLPTALPPGTYLSATATDAAGDTSEFSGVIQITTVTPLVTLTAANAAYTGSAYATANLTTTVTPAAASGSVSYVFYSGAAGQTTIATPIDAGTYYVRAVFASSDSGYTNAQSAIVPFTITAKSLTVEATTQGTLNIAKAGTISFALQITAGLVAGNNNVAALFNGAVFTIAVDGTSYSLTSTATVAADGTINISMTMSQGLQNALLTALSEGSTVDFSLSALSNGGDYAIAADAISRLISEGKLKFAVV
jgi:hypothetical protein